MRIFKAYIIVVALLLAAMSCNRQRALSDAELALVFRDAFISNAYTTNKHLTLDSLRLYEPIFEKYGYTTADVQYTIGSFANRKSARLSDVVERAIDMLEEVGEELDYQVSILDTIDNIAVRHSIRTVYEEPELKMRSFRDTSKLKISLEDLDIGEYDLTFDYLIDSLDTTPGNYQIHTWIEDRSVILEKGEKPRQYRKKNGIHTRNNVSKYDNTFNINNANDVINIELAVPSRVKGTPNVTIKRLAIKRRLNKAEARDTLFNELFPVRIFDNEILFKNDEKKDSL